MATRRDDQDRDAEHHEAEKTGESKKPQSPRVFPKERTRRSDADNRLKQADRFARILRTLDRVRSGGRWNLRELAQEEECSEQTIRRDLKVLEMAGIPCVYKAGEDAYRMDQYPRFPVLDLNSDEVLELAKAKALTDAVAQSMGLSRNTGAEPTARKLAATNEEAGQILQDAEQLVAVLGLSFSDHSRHQETIQAIQRALLKGKQLKGIYRSPHEAKSVTLTLHPYQLALVKQAWYLIARPADGDQPLTFRVPRFKSLRVLETTASVPADFDLRQYFGDAWAVYRGDRSYKVTLQFSKEAADLVTETRWHHTQEKPKKNPDGTVTITFKKIDGLNEILRWVLGWTGRVKVLEPQELKEKVAEQLQKGLDLNTW
jgi:predicted DNA-binding transcriptional regulator YafY